MQVPQADLSQSKRVGVDEQFIKFKSSPNFQVMKKFISLKIHKTETSNRSSPNNLPDPPNTEPSVSRSDLQSPTDNLESTSDAPLINADIEHGEYHSPNEAEPPESFPPQEEASRAESSGTGETPKPPESSIMCRDFIRGTCKRPGTCRYAHKCDKTQLFGVYTFCRNYQNKICTLPNCKYVHASVFEEQEFYRTGKLPPHVLAPKVPPPPVPPPSHPDPVPHPVLNDQSDYTHCFNSFALATDERLLFESRVDIPTSFSNPPPPLPMPPSIQANSAMFGCLPTNASEPRMFQEEFGLGVSGVRDNSYGEPPLKKCKNCDTMEIRFRCSNELLEKKREAVEDWKRKTSEVDTKKEKMSVILTGLLKLATTPSASNGPSSLFNITSNDKYKILEQLVSNNSNRMAVASGDNSGAGLLGENLSMATMIANFLSEHQSHSTDGGRRE